LAELMTLALLYLEVFTGMHYSNANFAETDAQAYYNKAQVQSAVCSSTPLHTAAYERSYY
jgi:hypothetical protein